MSESVTRSLTATVVAVVSPETQATAVTALCELSRHSGVRPVIVSLGSGGSGERRHANDAVVIEGLRPEYLDNAVASLRLSSLPTLAWWRAGDPAMLRDLASLVDRIVVDLDDPSGPWRLVPDLAPLAGIADLRWTRLTRWRDLIAQFFDVPEVRDARAPFARLQVAGGDRHSARLLGGWLRARLPAGERLRVQAEDADEPIRSVSLEGPAGRLLVRLLDNRTCLETAIAMDGGHESSRVVSLGDQRLAALLGEELRVRSRDVAFEDAVREAVRL